MKKHRLFIIKLSLFAGICFLVGFLSRFQVPKIKSWVLVKIEKLTEQNAPIRVLPGAIDLHLFPLGATLEDVKIFPKDEVKDVVGPIQISKVRFAISLLHLIQGRLKLSEVEISGSEVAINAPKPSRKSGPPLEGLFKIIEMVPIDSLEVHDIQLSISVPEPRMMVRLSDVSLLGEKQRDHLLLDLSCSSVHIRDKNTNAELGLAIEVKTLISPKSVTIPAIKVRRGESFVVASGSLVGDTEALKFDEFDLNGRTQFHLESMRNWAATAIKEMKTAPALRGVASGEVKFNKVVSKDPKAEFSLRTEGLRIAGRNLDKVKTAGTLANNVVKIPTLSIQNNYASATLENSTVHLGDRITLDTHVKVKDMSFFDMLMDITQGVIPVYAHLQADLPCTAELRPTLGLKCKGFLSSQGLTIKANDKDEDKMFVVNDLRAEGEVTVDKSQVTYSADLIMPNSKIKSQGTVVLDTGFKIDFEGAQIALKDIAHTVGLKVEGVVTKVRGSTEGNSDAATFQMAMEGTGMWLEDFWLGTVKSNVSYKSGLLNFKDMQGHYTTSRYFGEVGVQVYDKRLMMTGRIPFFDCKDLLNIFSRRVKLPMEITGTGTAQMKVSGPFQINAMTYDIKSTVFRGSVNKETFDQAFFDIRSRNGEVVTDRVQMNKGKAVITLKGAGHPNGQIETVIKGTNIRLEESNILNATGLGIAGGMDFEMDMKGPVLTPDTEMRGQLSKVSVSEFPVPDSKFRLRFSSKTLDGDGIFLGDAIKAAFTIPFSADAPFALDVTANDWNYAPLFAAMAGSASRKDFDGRISTHVKLASATGGFWNSTGAINVSQFSLSRGALALKAPETMTLKFTNGHAKVEKFYLEGENTFLKLVENTPAVNNIDLQVNGKLDLNLLFLLTPFFEEMRGILSLAFNLRTGPTKSEFLGSAYVDRGYIKLFDFPHPFEDIQADVLFSQKKILINSVKAELGGGRILGDGLIELKGYKNYPLQISASIDKATLNVPDKVRTTGSGRGTITGNWFPFLLKGTYDIREGIYGIEFDEGSTRGNVKRSTFLPQLILQESVAPLEFDVAVNFERGMEIKNSMMEGVSKGEITIKGNPAKPSMLGKLIIEKESKILFKENIFEVTNSEIQFLDPNEVNPKLYLAAVSRVQDHDINLIVQGFAKKPEWVLTSSPPLPEKEIISLLALGLTTDRSGGNLDTEGVASGQTGQGLSTSIISNALSKTDLTKEIKDKFGVNVQVVSGFSDGSNVATQKIEVSRQLTEKISVSANTGLGPKREGQGKVKLKLNKSLSLVGTVEGQQTDEAGETSQTTTRTGSGNKLGLDLEYKFKFK